MSGCEQALRQRTKEYEKIIRGVRYCPFCGSKNIELITKPEAHKEWICHDCGKTFSIT
jgi:transposase-like protein